MTWCFINGKPPPSPWVMPYMRNAPHELMTRKQPSFITQIPGIIFSMCVSWFGCQHILLFVSSNLAIYRDSLLLYLRNKWLLEGWAQREAPSCLHVATVPCYKRLQLWASADRGGGGGETDKQNARLALRTGFNTVYIAPVWCGNVHNPRTQVFILAT